MFNIGSPIISFCENPSANKLCYSRKQNKLAIFIEDHIFFRLYEKGLSEINVWIKNLKTEQFDRCINLISYLRIH